MKCEEPADLGSFPNANNGVSDPPAPSEEVCTGIWIGATSAFQQRLAQREQLATELSFLEGMLRGTGKGEADGGF